ncbi:hypothetical protein M422DRAFT_276760 [Sphaerobolus stellatus SS14]|uniref:Endonuclease/exonuclease/phosphatase domain-containing protein n=1 Tax=Sphaerobolus stellatus (strain SS14) TaxID=990650 RepID=A0A0C9UB65_SPHS4|nr:hypothetical protein M422DRAFT_276760 [Sphaerobolus stellatus SS14]
MLWAHRSSQAKARQCMIVCSPQSIMQTNRKNRSITPATTKHQRKNATQTANTASGYTTRLSVSRGGRTAGSHSNEVDRENLSRPVTNRSQSGRFSLQGGLPHHDDSVSVSRNGTSTSVIIEDTHTLFSSVNTPTQNRGPTTSRLHTETTRTTSNNLPPSSDSDTEGSDTDSVSVNNKSSHSSSTAAFSSDSMHLLSSDILDNTPSRNTTQARAHFPNQRRMPRPSSPEFPQTSDDFHDFLALRQRTNVTALLHQNPSQTPPVSNVRKVKKNTRGSLQISSLNIRGGGSNTTREKWGHLWQVMRQTQTGVLAIQESHITDTVVQGLEDTFNGRMQILSSIDESNPNSKGVVFLLNKQLTAWKATRVVEIILGRALLLLLPWHQDQTLNILNIYAPNPHSENESFWSDLHKKWKDDGLPMVHFLLGDFNIVEDSIDRLPAHNDPQSPRESLAKFKSLFGLLDGWRHENPDIVAHTWHQSQRDIHSRLDRIYTTEAIFKHTCNWSISPPPIHTDHDIVNVRVFNIDMPYVGNGRWTIPLFTLKEEKIMKESIYNNFKTDLIGTIRDYAKKCIPMIQKEIQHKISQLEQVLNNTPDPIEKATLASDLKEI